MSEDQLRKRDRVPWVSLKECFGGGDFVLRPSRGPRVYVAMHQADCDECVRYAQAIASIRGSVASWGGDIVVVCAEGGGESSTVLPRLGVPVLEDPEHVLADGRLTVTVADEWGEVYFASEPDDSHSVISPEQVIEWVKFIAIQCPECEGPEGEWRNL